MQMTLMGKKYDVAVGSCCSPEEQGKYITIPIDGKTLDELETIIHEMLHACFWFLSEEAVTRAAHDLARNLWRLKWRKTSRKQLVNSKKQLEDMNRVIEEKIS